MEGVCVLLFSLITFWSKLDPPQYLKSHNFITNIVHHQHRISKVIKQCLDHKKGWVGKRSRKVKIIRSIRKGPELLAHLNSHYGSNQHKERQVDSKHQEQHLEGEEGGKGRNNMKSNRRSTQIPFVAGIECNLLFHMGGHNPTQAPQVERCDLVRILQKP